VASNIGKSDFAISMEGAPGYFGTFGGRFVPETLIAPLDELTAAFEQARLDPAFQWELRDLLTRYSGRPTPVYFAERLSRELGGARIYLKREDLSHTGSHKINRDGLCAPGARMCRVHGSRRHQAPGVERVSHEVARF
jgi:tryptophan synthase beta subunit